MKILSTKRFNKAQKEKFEFLNSVIIKCVKDMNDDFIVYHNIINSVIRAIKNNDYQLAEERTINYTQR